MLGFTLAPRDSNSTPTADLSAVERSLGLLDGSSSDDPPQAFVCDVTYAVADLLRGERQRAVVRVQGPWEMGLERVRGDILVSVFRGGPSPEVPVFERRIAETSLLARLLDSLHRDLDEVDDQAQTPLAANTAPLFEMKRGLRIAPRKEPAFVAPLRNEALSAAAEHLRSVLPPCDAEPAELMEVSVEAPSEGAFGIAAEFSMRAPKPTQRVPGAARSDLFSLLIRGKLRLTAREAEREMDAVFLFPFAEQLVPLAIDGIDAWSHGRALFRRVDAAGTVVGLRLSPRGVVALTLGKARNEAHTFTFSNIDGLAFAQGVLSFGRGLVRSLIRRDRGQLQNLRVTSLKGHLRDLEQRLRDATQDESKVNDAPHAYRAYAMAPVAKPEPDAFSHARLRFAATWTAAVPGLDLRSTFLCGDALLVGSATRTTCFHRATGDIVWERETGRAVSVPTPRGLARLTSDGALSLYDYAAGEPLFQLRLAPRVGTGASGAVVGGPGLPRLLIVSEGARHLCAVDLDTGDVRWRYAARRGANFRLKRVGRLVLVAAGDASLVALDVVTGEIVWRFCDRLRFGSHVAFDRDAVFAVSGHGALGGQSGGRLHHIDPWTGRGRWSSELPGRTTAVGAPLVTPNVVLVASNDRGTTTLSAFDRASGDALWSEAACGAAASCLVVDDAVVLNGENGELLALEAETGQVRYRHVFGGEDGDRPRRLEPVLRSGALFVPQRDVHVVRPRDGTLLGTVGVDLVPDLLRVDEKCNVYVAEESGHLAAFGAGPRLMVVK